MAARSILSLCAIILLAGGIVLQFFVILSGAVNGGPENKIWFLEASTAGIPGSGTTNVPNPTRWTYFAICGVKNGKNADCHDVRPALPFSPVQNFQTKQGIPDQFVAHTDRYYYLSRFMFAFYLVALFFSVIGFLLCIAAFLGRLGAMMTGLFSLLACFFQAVTASLMTAWTVLGRDAFRKNGQTAQIGTYAYAFTWSAFVCFLISTVLFCIGGGRNKTESTRSSGYFGRKRSTRSRGSFIDSESGRRVKDEYD